MGLMRGAFSGDSVSSRRVPQFPQKRIPGGFSNPQLPHNVVIAFNLTLFYFFLKFHTKYTAKFVDIFWQSMYNSARIVPAGYAGTVSCIPIPQLPRIVAGAEPKGTFFGLSMGGNRCGEVKLGGAL